MAVAITLAFTPAAVEAHLPAYQTRAVESDNGEFVLVLLMPVEMRAERRDATEYDSQLDGPITQTELRDWAERVARQKDIEARYPQSGLYRNDGSTELIWPSSYISTCREVFIASDGRHLVAAKDMHSSCWDSDEPLVFYASGKKVAEHDHYEALPGFWMRALIGEWFDVYLPYDIASGIDNDVGIFFVETNQHDTLIYDLATGKCVASRSPWPYCFGALALGPSLGFWACRRRMRRGQGAESGGRSSVGFSLRELLALTALIAAALAAAHIWGGVAAACAIIATSGALVARIRAGATRGWFAGAIAALYAAYMMLLLSAVIDGAVLDGFTLLRVWVDKDSSKWAPFGVLAVGALAASWFAGRMFAADKMADASTLG